LGGPWNDLAPGVLGHQPFIEIAQQVGLRHGRGLVVVERGRVGVVAAHKDGLRRRQLRAAKQQGGEA